MSSQFDRQVLDGTVVFSVRAPFSEDIFADFLEEEALKTDAAIVLDLTPLPATYVVSSESLGSLVRAYTLISRQNGELLLVGMPSSRRAQLDGLFQLRTVFNSYKTVEDAIRKLRARP